MRCSAPSALSGENMKPGLKPLLAALAALACAGFGAPQGVEYTLTPVMRDGALEAVQFDLRFRGEADGETALRLPQSWGGQEELWRGIDGLRVVSGAQMRDGEGPGERVLAHRPNAPIHVRYRVIQDWEGAPNAEHGNTYRPAIQPSYFHLIGDASLVVPDGLDLGAPARLRVRNLPRGWAFASDLEHGGLTKGKLWASVMVGGDFRVLRDAESGVRVAMRGQWGFDDAEFAGQAAEIIAGHRRFWGDAPAPYLVTVLQLEGPEGWLSIGGTGLGDAFAFFATPNIESAPITRTLAHEGTHTWIPSLIGGALNEDEALQYWLSEGFTDFYTGRLLVREGVWTPAEFAADLNEMLLAYAQSPARTEPNARVLADFWNDQAVQKLPYQRGRLLATIWDARLRAAAAGSDFDDVMLEMRARASGGDALKAVEMFPVVAESFGLDVRADIASFVDSGAAILLPEDVFAPCGRVVTREAPVFHRGFDIEATQANDNVIAGVDPGLPAYAAGLRDGMVLVRRNGGEIGDAEQEIAYIVRDGEEERTFRYMPSGRGTFTLQQLVLDGELEGERLAQCVAVLGGA
jgi:predicted metalloprotease with PDZ domain